MNENNFDYLTPAQAFEKYSKGIEWLDAYLKSSFSMQEYMPIVRGELEDNLNRLQFLLSFSAGNPYMSSQDKVILGMLVTQVCFWLGYTEAQKPKIEIPDVFKRALGEE